MFEGAVIGQVFTGQVRISAPQLLQQRRPRNHEKQRKSLWRRPAFSKGNAMERGTEFTRTRFSVDTVRAAIQAVREVIGETKAEVVHESLKVDLPDGQWRFDDENEFYAAIPQGTGYGFIVDARSVRIQVTQFRRSAVVDVRAPTRAQVQRIFSPFDNRQGAEAVPADSPVVFVGHGRSPAWKDLRDHLRDQHDYRVECYESGARAGHSIRDILESMAAKSSFAVLVMTGEDMQESGTLRARQNVIHEAGLFQGRLGFSRAIILLEEGVEQFSNVQGVQYIPFAKDRIREAYGDVLATLRREFGGG
ncbi:hypothetical protein GUK69_08075 [Stenotrophomonas maltophilia]|nr:hypothetical protein [Stenotrophomonas maltophilia]